MRKKIEGLLIMTLVELIGVCALASVLGWCIGYYQGSTHTFGPMQ